MRPLQGQTILLTRPRSQSAGISARLERLGARVLAAPVIRTVPPSSWQGLDRALPGLSRYAILVFTSANGVESFFFRARKVLGREPDPPPRLCAIGPATAKALRGHGWRAAEVPAVHEASALAKAMGSVRGSDILIPRAEKAREILPRMLRRAGARVRVVKAYRTVPDPRGARLIRTALAKGTDWVTFTSASTVDHFFRAAGGGAARLFGAPLRAAHFARGARPRSGYGAPLRAASIGPITSAALRRRGVEPSAEASPYTSEGLVRAIRRSSPPASDLRRTLLRALRESGRVLMDKFGKVKMRYKGKANLVTAADHASEQRILDIVLDRFPDHDFLTEERAPRESGSDFSWVIDPLDGTTNYAHGFPAFCVSIALLRRGSPLMAGILDPVRRELFWAEAGKGAFLNGKRLRVTRTRRLSESLLLTGFAYDRVKRSAYLVRFYREFMVRSHDVRRSGSAALDLAWTAAGRVDGYWEFNLNPWDVAAGVLLVREAGGMVSDFHGRAWGRPKTWGPQTLASNGLIHKSMLRVISQIGVRR